MMRDKKVGAMLAGAMVIALTGVGTASGQVGSSSDLHLTKTADDQIGVVGEDVTYTLTVHNDGPDAADNMVVTDVLPTELDAQSISASGLGTCTLIPTLSCSFPTLASGASETVTLLATPLEAAPVRNDAEVSSDSADADLSDNVASYTVRVAPAECTQVGTRGDDRLVGTSGTDMLCGMGGADVLIGRGGKDRLLAGPGKDVLKGGAKSDRLVAGGGNDRLLGAGGSDVLKGGGGADVLRGGPQRDRLFGQAGRDRCIDAGRDRTSSC
jgi:uncharacterized repeat protein (TIGR01451 family)